MATKEQMESFIAVSKSCAFGPDADLFPEVVEQAMLVIGKETLAGHLEIPSSKLESWAKGEDLPDEPLVMYAMARNWMIQVKKMVA